ncbi:MAG: glycine/betaine/sarcosine/D-proline family reductase selenoprotein B [Acidimicrobiia bacterium]|nr:glycine/betaine/sarcosine/D-proline family reductase selenoprotein B [Acidimicrobiia bacterium]
MSETFEQFRRSFSYGSRSDLNFKFLKGLSDDDAAEFFRQLLEELGDAFDHGDLDVLVQLAIDWQIRGYAPPEGVPRPWAYDDGPFVDPAKPLSESRVALFSSSGHFVAGDDPEPFGVNDMTQEEAEERIMEFLVSRPTLSRIPIGTVHADLRVRHGGYDITSAAADPGVTFPVAVLRELDAEGIIGELHADAFSFPGATAQKRLINESGPEWAQLLADEGVDLVLLVPV